MTWILLVVIGFVATAVAANLATVVRDYLQDDLVGRRKLKASGSHEGNRILLIILFPITLYLILGTLLLLLLYVIEMAASKLRRYSGEVRVEVIAWHQVSVYLALLFPILWPLVALMVGLVFVGAVLLAIFTAAQKALNGVLRFVRRIWVTIVHALQAFLEWIIDTLRLVWDLIVEGTQIIWELIVEGTQTVWEMVVGKTQQILEQLTTLIQGIWATINGRMRL